MGLGGTAAEPAWDAAETAASALDLETFAIVEDEPEAAAMPRRTRAIVTAGFALLLVAGWLALVGYAARVSIRPSGDRLLDLFALLPVAAGPVALIGIGWLLLQRTSRREAYRFAATAVAMRAEARAMEVVLARIGAAITANRHLLANQSAELLALGEKTSDRLGAVRRMLAMEGETLARQTVALERATVGARSEMDALLTDIPHAEARSRAFAAELREAGLGAHEQAGVLETQVAALTARGREADEAAGGAAERLATQLARIEAHGGAAARELERATAALRDGVDQALAAAAAALAETRGGIDAQGHATLAMVETARAALTGAGEAAAAALSDRLDRTAGRIEMLGRRIGEQDAAGRALVERLAGGLEAVDAQLVALDEHGRERSASIEQAVGALRGQTERAILAVGDGAAAADRLNERAGALRATIDAIGREIDSLPPSLDAVDEAARRSRAAVAEAGPETARLEAAARAAADRLMRVQASFAGQQATVDRIGESVTARIADIEAHAQALEDIEDRFARFGDAGAERTADLAEAIVALSGHAKAIAGTFGASVGEAEALAGRIAGLETSLDAIRDTLGDALPAALADVTAGAERARVAMARSRPEAAALEMAVDRAVARLGEVDAAAAERRGEIVAAGDAAEARLTRLTAALDGLRDGLARVGAEADEVADAAAPRLIEAMLRVREAAGAAAATARETLAGVIPAAAASLGEASRAAIEEAVAPQVEAQLAEVAAASERAVAAAHRATDRLMRQMLTIADTTAAVEARIAEAHGEIAAKDEESFSRRVALLIESLNSTAIDVAKILSADIGDAAWAAYLRGDRGVFTRRAVRLLDAGDAREVARVYQEEPAVREQVNRYIHDFEAMLRRVLANRDGAPLGVTLLSSDMGKLYVALAQAIERLRT